MTTNSCPIQPKPDSALQFGLGLTGSFQTGLIREEYHHIIQDFQTFALDILQGMNCRGVRVEAGSLAWSLQRQSKKQTDIFLHCLYGALPLSKSQTYLTRKLSLFYTFRVQSEISSFRRLGGEEKEKSGRNVHFLH